MRRFLMPLLALVLLIPMLPAPHPAIAQDTNFCEDGLTEPIEYNATLTGTINDANTVTGYCFSGTAGDTVTVTALVVSGDLDVQIALFDPFLLEDYAYNDDIDASTNNAEFSFTLPTTGQYVIVVSRIDVAEGKTSGNYVLVLTARGTSRGPTTTLPTVPPSIDSTDSSTNDTDDADAPAAQVDVCESPLTIIMNYGQTRRALIDDLHSGISYCFEGDANDIVTLEAVAVTGDLDTVIYLTDPFFEEVYAENDDIAIGESNSAITDFVLPEDGRYLVVVTRFGENSGQTSGEFELTLSGAAGPPTTTTDTTVVVEPTTPPATNESVCASAFETNLSANTWQSLTDAKQTITFNCDGTLVWVDGSVTQSGIFSTSEDTIVITLLDSNTILVWEDVLLVAGFLNAITPSGDEVFFTEAVAD